MTPGIQSSLKTSWISLHHLQVHTFSILACGTGLVSFAAARAVGLTGSVTGVDISDGMLDMAKQELEKFKAGGSDRAVCQNIRFFNHSITDLSSLEAIRGQKFDAITCASALVLLDHPFLAVNSWTEFLRPGGALVTDAIHPRNLIGGVALERTCARLGVQAPSPAALDRRRALLS